MRRGLCPCLLSLCDTQIQLLRRPKFESLRNDNDPGPGMTKADPTLTHSVGIDGMCVAVIVTSISPPHGSSEGSPVSRGEIIDHSWRLPVSRTGSLNVRRRTLPGGAAPPWIFSFSELCGTCDEAGPLMMSRKLPLFPRRSIAPFSTSSATPVREFFFRGMYAHHHHHHHHHHQPNSTQPLVCAACHTPRYRSLVQHRPPRHHQPQICYHPI